MSIHFNSHQDAINHLTTNGWKECKTGRFVSRDGSCAAHILSTCADVVLVQIWEVGA